MNNKKAIPKIALLILLIMVRRTYLRNDISSCEKLKAKCYFENFSDDHYFHHPINVNNFKLQVLYITHYFKSFLFIRCKDSLLILQNNERNFIKQCP